MLQMSLMLRPAALTSVLGQANTGGVRCTILFDRDGNSISSAGEWPNSDSDICAAVAANIWLTLERARRVHPHQIQVVGKGNAVGGSNSSGQLTAAAFLEFTVLEFDSGLLGVARIQDTEFMITCLADTSCEFGMMKKKVLAVADYLREPLKSVSQ